MKKVLLILLVSLLVSCTGIETSELIENEAEVSQEIQIESDEELILQEARLKLTNDLGDSPTVEQIKDDLRYAYVDEEHWDLLSVELDDKGYFDVVIPLEKWSEQIFFFDPNGYLASAYLVEEIDFAFEARGFVSLESELPFPCENASDEGCSFVDVLYFNIIEGGTEAETFLMQRGEKMRFGCMLDDHIYYVNDSGTYGFGQFELSPDLSQNILSSSEEKPIDLSFEVLVNHGGRTPPPCYVDFTYVNELNNNL